jgi:hypothetical protein
MVAAYVSTDLFVKQRGTSHVPKPLLVADRASCLAKQRLQRLAELALVEAEVSEAPTREFGEQS